MLRINENYYYLKAATVGEQRKILEFRQSLHSGGSITGRQDLLYDLVPRIYEKLTHGFFKWAVISDRVEYFNQDGEAFAFDGVDGETKLYQFAPHLISHREQEINRTGLSYMPLKEHDSNKDDQPDEELSAAEHYQKTRQSLLEYYHFIIYGNSFGGSYMTMAEVDNLTIRDFIELGVIAQLKVNTKIQEISYDEDFIAENNEKNLTMSLEEMKALTAEYATGGEEESE